MARRARRDALPDLLIIGEVERFTVICEECGQEKGSYSNADAAALGAEFHLVSFPGHHVHVISDWVEF